MRKIRNSYESFRSLGEGTTLGILESRLSAMESNWQKFEDNDKQMQAIKKPDDSLREYYIKNFYDLAEDAFIDIRGQYWEHRFMMSQQAEGSQASSISQAPAAISRKLPVIPIPKFNGESNS